MKLFKKKSSKKAVKNTVNKSDFTTISEAVKIVQEARMQYHKDTLTALYLPGYTY